MLKYFVNLKNKTDRTWVMAVYQTYPKSIGLDSVAWKKTTVPRSGASGVWWKMQYSVGLADYEQTMPLGVYYGKQFLPADIGSEWEIRFEDGCQQLYKVGDLYGELADHILIHNNSGVEANPGVGIDGSAAVYKRDILSNTKAQFMMKPIYWVGLFRDVRLGEVISVNKSNVDLGPIKIEFGEGANVANITAVKKGGAMKVHTSYSRT